MTHSENSQNAAEYYARTYDLTVSDWPGEIDFYGEMAAAAKSTGGSVLELACGTGRVAIRLAQDGVNVLGLDLSPAMIAVARQKSAGLANLRWVVGDMSSFELEEVFDLVIIPGHAFQCLNTPQEQIACLDCIRRHLTSGGTLVIHLDHMSSENMRWLGELCAGKGGVFEPAGQFRHPDSGRQVHTSRAWSYEPATQTAIAQTVWEELDAARQVVNRIEKPPVRLHCLFRFEMDHLLARAGFDITAVYGNFFRKELRDDSTEMVWIAKHL